MTAARPVNRGEGADASKREHSWMAFADHVLRLAAASLIGLAVAQTAAAQQAGPMRVAEDNWLTRLFQPSAAPAVPPAASGVHEWSGQSGASGNPLMTADAIRAASAATTSCATPPA